MMRSVENLNLPVFRLTADLPQDLLQYFMTDAVVVRMLWLPVLQLCNYVVLIVSKNQSIHTSLYRTIYRCIVIQKRQYIITPK